MVYCIIYIYASILKGRDCSLFINVCKWAKVPHPLTDADPVPVKGGTLRYDVVNGHKTVNFVYDIAFNPQVVEECSSNPVLFDMLTFLSLDFVEDMTKLNVHRDTVAKSDVKGTQAEIHYSLDEGLKHLLPKESRLDFGDSLLDELGRLSSSSAETGELPPLKLPHQERNTSKKPLIEELPSTPYPNNSEVIKRPHYTVDVVSIGEKKGLQVKVKLPGVRSVNDVNLEISEVSSCFNVMFHSLYILRLIFSCQWKDCII